MPALVSLLAAGAAVGAAGAVISRRRRSAPQWDEYEPIPSAGEFSPRDRDAGVEETSTDRRSASRTGPAPTPGPTPGTPPPGTPTGKPGPTGTASGQGSTARGEPGRGQRGSNPFSEFGDQTASDMGTTSPGGRSSTGRTPGT